MNSDEKHHKKAKKHKSKHKSKHYKRSTDDERVKSKKHKSKRKRDRSSSVTSTPPRHKKRIDDVEDGADCNIAVPETLAGGDKSMAPLTKEAWEKQQSVVRRVYDESTGRHRLIKGDGEVIEEIVSRDRHKAINKQATSGDGSFFEKKTLGK